MGGAEACSFVSVQVITSIFFLLFLLVQHTFLRGWELKIFSKAFMNWEHSNQYNKRVKNVRLCSNTCLFFLSPVIKSVLPHDSLTPDFLYPVLMLAFSTTRTYKQKSSYFLSSWWKVWRSCLVPGAILIIVTTLDLPALSDVVTRSVCRLITNYAELRTGGRSLSASVTWRCINWKWTRFVVEWSPYP